jgi:hypothetical protein
MLKFNDLSMSQKKFIVTVVEYDPSLLASGTITLKQVNAICSTLAEQRAAGGAKIGYPNWLFAENKIERGLYSLPIPSTSDLSEYYKDDVAAKAPKQKQVIKSQYVSEATNDLEDLINYTEQDFNEELRAAGIAV